jgi:glycine/D-amino acid oxidase-like deaminating enzyme
MSQKRILIVGQGIAGSLLAWQLLEAGSIVHLIDDGADTGATHVAPGILNPLAGKRLQPSWRVEEQLKEAHRVYEVMESRLQAQFFHRKPILRIFKDVDQQVFFRERQADPVFRRYVETELESSTIAFPLKAPLGGFVSRFTGYLETGTFLSTCRRWFLNEGLLWEHVLKPEMLKMHVNRSVYCAVTEQNYDAVVFCEGWSASVNPFFNWLPFKPAKGEMLDLKSVHPVHLPDMILNCGKWLLPLGNGHYRAGASYGWEPLDTVITDDARETLLSVLASFLDITFEVTGQRAGIRPILKDFRPVLGAHPNHPSLFIFNGLGSKGVLAGPWLAKQMTAHLLGGDPIPHEMNLQRFKRYYSTGT